MEGIGTVKGSITDFFKEVKERALQWVKEELGVK